MVPVYCCPKRVLVIHNSLIKTTPFHQSQFMLWSRVVNCGSQEVAVCSNSAMLQCYLTPIWQCFVLNNGVLRNNWDLFKFCHSIALLFDNNSMKENGFLFCFWNAFYIKIKIDPLLPDGCVCVFFKKKKWRKLSTLVYKLIWWTKLFLDKKLVWCWTTWPLFFSLSNGFVNAISYTFHLFK